MFGSHLSIAGGLHNALIEARRLKMDCVQIFTKNQRQWKVPPLTDEQVTLWQQHRKQTKIDQVVSHDSYLINLASPDSGNRTKSINLFRDELVRCEALGIQNLVTHPGAHMKEGEAKGIKRVAQSLNAIHRELPGLKVVTCLEVTAGQGTTLGYKLEHLQQIIDQCDQPDRLAVCLDTAHLLEAGYDLTSAKGARSFIDELDQILGLDAINAIHLNDSKTPLGSHVDRHEHIGHGYVSLDAFKVFVSKRVFAKIPKILETAKEDHPSGQPWDLVNLHVLRNLKKLKISS
jgi:deoxyribonuclease-4